MNLRTNYLGLSLRSPLVASASPIGTKPDSVREAVDAGVGAVVLPSFFEEQGRRQEAEDMMLMEEHEGSFGEATSYFPTSPTVATGGASAYLTHLEHVVAAVDVPVIASLNGTTTGGWTGVAKGMQEAGAAAIELNVYSVPSPTADSGHVIEQRHVEILRAVRESVSVPVAVKLSPYFSSTGEMAKSLVEAGADGLVLFNRFYQPDVDVETLTVSSSLTWSAPQEARLPRTWIAILRNQVTASLAGTTGVHHGHDVAAYLLAGADVVMTASALLEHGPAHAGTILEQLGSWMQRKGFANVKDVRGLLAVPPGIDVGMHERSGYVGVLSKAKATYGEI